jgi:hypothetical protein
VDQVLVEVELGAVQREDFTGAQRLVADREDGALKHEPVVIGPAPSRASPKPRVTLIADDLEARAIDPALALARAELGKEIASAEG